MSISNILFDLDGTLTDPMEGITKSVQYALSCFGITIQDHTTLSYFIGPPLGETFIKHFGFDEPSARIAVAKYREYFAPTGIFQNELYGGVEELLAKLQESGKRLFIATGKPTVFAKKVAEHFDIQKYFTDIYGIELSDLNLSKSETIEKLMRDYDIRCSDAAMVGDRIFDVDAAKANRLLAIGVRYGYATPEELEGRADFLVDTVRELQELLINL